MDESDGAYTNDGTNLFVIYIAHITHTNMQPYWDMVGGGNCTLCRSPGTNKSTCPLNPKAKRPNPAKHPLAQRVVKTVPKQVLPPPQLPKAAKTPKVVAKCTNNAYGIYILERLSASLYDTSLDQVGLFDEKIDDLVVLSKDELDTPVTEACDRVVVEFMDVDGDARKVRISARKDGTVTVRDVVEAFLQNNELVHNEMREELGLGPDEEVNLGDSVHYDGTVVQGPGRFSMMEFS